MVRESKGKIFYGWYIVVAGLLITGAGVGMFTNTVGVFVKPVCEDLGFERGQFTLCTTIFTLVSLFLMPLFSTLFRKYGIKRFLIMGAVGTGFIPIAYSFSSHLWQFYLIAFVNGLLFNGVNFLAVGTLVGAWFQDKKGVATGIAYAGSGLLTAIAIPIATAVIQQADWRWAYRILAVSGMALMIPMALFVIKGHPEEMGLEPYTDPKKGKAVKTAGNPPPGLTLPQAVKTPALWLLVAGILGLALCAAGPNSHTASYLSDIGYTTAYASTVTSLYMLVLTAGKIFLGMVFDRFGALAGSLFAAICCIAQPILAMAAGIQPIPIIFAVTLGFANAAGTVSGSSLTAQYFGERDFASIFSICTMASTLGASLSPPIMGAIYDITGSYALAWKLILGCALLSALLWVGAYVFSRPLVAQRKAAAAKDATVCSQ